MSHTAKQLALEAYASALLSPRAARHLERHLTGCARCTSALANVRAYAQLREEVHAQAVPDPSWERLETALDSEFRSRAEPRAAEFRSHAEPRASTPTRAPGARNTGKLIALAWPLLAIAATLVIAWLGRSGPMTPSEPVAQHAVPSAPAPRMVVGWVSLLAGSATLEHGSARSQITLDTPIHEGDLLNTAANAQLQVALDDATGFALAPDTRLRIAKLRVGDTLLALSSGRVTNQVRKLPDGEAYQVLVHDLTARVRGTRFWVEAGANNEAAVFVHEGRVEVARGDQLLSTLEPGQGYPSARFATPSAGNATPQQLHLARPAGPESFALVLPPLPTIRAWRVEGTPISSAGTLAMRLPPGPSQLKFEDPRGQIRSIQIDLTAPLTVLEPAALDELITPKAMPVGYLSPEQIASVVRSAIDPLRRCYERNLRSEPNLESKFVLRMRVSAEGRVVRSEVDAQAKLPLDLERCIELEAHKLLFPKPEGGGPLSFEVPLNLRSGR